ncbi:hypothetical protein V8C35DRAFT_102292 [Trichoderma chlorosporum]
MPTETCSDPACPKCHPTTTKPINLTLGVVLLGLTFFPSLDSTYSFPAIFIAAVLFVLKDYSIFRQELLSEGKHKWAVIIAAVPLLLEPTLRANLIPAKLIDVEQNWILIAFLFLLFFQSTEKHSALSAAYSSGSGFVVALLAFFLLRGHSILPLEQGQSILPFEISNPAHLQSLLLALGTYYGSPTLSSSYRPGIVECMIIPAAWLVASSFRITEAFSNPYLQLVFLGILALIGIICATINIAGPLRYAYRNYIILYANLRQKIPSWSHFPLLWLAFHPWTGWWLLGGSLCVTWQYVREHHREAAAEITRNAEKAKIRASSLLTWARDEAAAAERCELQVHNLATGITRDARSAHYVGLAGFYHEAAAHHSPEGKIAYATAAGNTSNIAIRVTRDAQKATEAARAVRDSADSVSKLTIDAQSLAAIGDIEAAKAVVSDLQVALENCEKSHGVAVIARKSAQLMMAKFHYKVFKEHQEDDSATPQEEELIVSHLQVALETCEESHSETIITGGGVMTTEFTSTYRVVKEEEEEEEESNDEPVD